MKIQKILLLYVLLQGFSLQATIIATWNEKLFLQVVSNVVIVTNNRANAAHFIIKFVGDCDHGKSVITGDEPMQCLFFDRITESIHFDCIRYGNILIGSPIPETPFWIISYGNGEYKKYLKLGIDGDLELSANFFNGRAWWKFVDE